MEKTDNKEKSQDIGRTLPSEMLPANTSHDADMFTDANTHEIEDTGMAATLGSPWSAELPGDTRL